MQETKTTSWAMSEVDFPSALEAHVIHTWPEFVDYKDLFKTEKTLDDSGEIYNNPPKVATKWQRGFQVKSDASWGN